MVIVTRDDASYTARRMLQVSTAATATAATATAATATAATATAATAATATAAAISGHPSDDTDDSLHLVEWQYLIHLRYNNG